jgi:hypothetical protein
MEKGNKSQINITVEPDLRKAFNAYAQSKGFSPGSLIRNFIITTLEAAEEKKSA